MKTLDLNGAAEWLKCDPETVRALAAAGDIPAAKVGRAWVFVDVDLIEWLRSKYPEQRQTKTAKRPATPHTPTPFIRRNKTTSGTSNFEEALGLPPKRPKHP